MEKSPEKKRSQFHIYTFGILRKLYEWVLSWADSKYAAIALFLLAFIEASFFLIPPDPLLIALAVSRPKKAWKYALICTAGSVLGALLGWFIGFALYDLVGRRIIEGFGYQNYFTLVGNLYQQNAFWFIFTAAFTPIPYKVFTIAAGVWNISIPVLLLASVLGRGGRFFIVAGLIYLFGPKIKDFIDKYFELLTVAVLVLIVAGFFVIRYL